MLLLGCNCIFSPCCYLCYTSHFSHFLKGMENWNFQMLVNILHFQNFFKFPKILKIEITEYIKETSNEQESVKVSSF